MKVILFYSSIGQGHISAARSIEKEILKQDPSAIVLQKDIREFMDPIARMLDEKLYWFVAKNLPILFDNLFQSMQEQGSRVGTLACLPNDYSEQKVYEYLLAEAPDAVLATHYGSAQILGNLRERALIPNIKIGWLHTDYFVGYFPRISKRIDRTFLAHPALEKSWLEAGVFPDLVETSGMPVNIPSTTSGDSKDCLSQIGFSPSIKTIVLASGKEGIGDFSGIIMSLAKAAVQPLQIIAVCGCNKKQFQALHKMKPQIPEYVKLEAMGFIPQTELISFIHASDLFITKAGGLSPAEAFVLGKPTILLNVISGHERENAELFAKLGLAEINFTVEEIGNQAQALLTDVAKQTAMLEAQQEFRRNMDIGKIVAFLLDPKMTARNTSPEFGLENGLSARYVQSTLAQLENNIPTDIEILLSYSSSKEDERIAMENPFGHIAIRIGDMVYSSNYRANPEKEPLLLQHMSLENYLFGIFSSSDSQEHTSTYGMAYGRDTLGLRIKGFSTEAIQGMRAEVADIEEEYRLGKCKYDVKKSNCADFVQRILRASGYNIGAMHGLSLIYSMPLDAFEQARETFEAVSGFHTELVAYRRLPSSQSPYRFSRFPLSLSQPGRALTQILNNTTVDRLESRISIQLTGYIGDDRVFYEELAPRGIASAFDDFDRLRRRTMKIERVLASEARRLLKEKKILHIEDYRTKLEQHIGREINCLIDNCYDTARIATEHVESMIGAMKAQTLREAFVKLTEEYAELSCWRNRSTDLINFHKKLSEFYQVIEQDDKDQKQQNLVREIKTLSLKLEKRVISVFGDEPRAVLLKSSNNQPDRKEKF